MDGLIIGKADGVGKNIVLDWLAIEIVQVWPQVHVEESHSHVVQIVTSEAFVLPRRKFLAEGQAGDPVVTVGALPGVVLQPAGAANVLVTLRTAVRQQDRKVFLAAVLDDGGCGGRRQHTSRVIGDVIEDRIGAFRRQPRWVVGVEGQGSVKPLHEIPSDVA